MIIQDMMIGDWVQLNGEPMQVSRIDLYSVNAKPAFCCSSPHNIWSYNNDFKPIRLTIEILEKNEFEKASQVSDTEPFDTDEEGNKHYSYNKTFWGWFQPDNIFCIPANGMGWLQLKYVHELQHVLKLCGINKEIKL